MDGKTYAEVLRQIKQVFRPEEMETSMKAVRQTRAGGLLVVFGPDAANKNSFRDAVQKAVGEKASISSLEPRVTLEIREIDCVRHVGEVEVALQRDFRAASETKMRVTSKISRGQ